MQGIKISEYKGYEIYYASHTFFTGEGNEVIQAHTESELEAKIDKIVDRKEKFTPLKVYRWISGGGCIAGRITSIHDSNYRHEPTVWFTADTGDRRTYDLDKDFTLQTEHNVNIAKQMKANSDEIYRLEQLSRKLMGERDNIVTQEMLSKQVATPSPAVKSTEGGK